MLKTTNVAKVETFLWPQWLAAAEVFLLSVVIGLGGGWTSPYLAKLTAPNTTSPVTEEEASWIAAVMNLGRPVGAVTGSLAIDYIGSRKATLMTGVPTALGWLIQIIGETVPWICLSRVMTGIGLGMYFCTFPIYIGEISNQNIRGALVCLITQGMPFGVLLGTLVGAYSPMWVFSCFSLVPNMAFIASFMVMPDSAHYLLQQERPEDAKRSLEWYNRNSDVGPELESLKDFLSEKAAASYFDQVRQLFSPSNTKAVIVVSIVFLVVQLSGLWTVCFYMEIILKNAGVSVIDPSLVVVIVGVLGIVFGWASMYANDKYGRRIILATSAFGLSLALLILGIDYQLLDWNFSSELVNEWLPIIAIVMFQSSLCIGVIPVPSTLLSEMFSPEIKSMATCLTNICSALVAFVSSKTYQPMVTLVSEKYVFWFYALVMVFLAVYAIVFMPETKGKTLPEIQIMLTQKKVKHVGEKSVKTIA